MALHHYVPQFYLKNFVGDDPKPRLWVYRRKDKPQKLPIEGIAAVQNFYRVTLAATGEKSEIFERLFSKLEGDVKPLIDRLLNDDSLITLSAEEFSLLSYFISLLYVRGRSFQSKVNNLRVRRLKYSFKKEAQDPDAFKILAERFDDSGDDQKHEELRRLTLNCDEHIEIKVKRGEDSEFLQTMFDSANQISPAIFAKTWEIYESNEKVFLTSDAPVTVMLYPNIPPSEENVFISGVVALPLSPSKCLLLTPGKNFGHLKVSNVSAARVNTINRNTMFHAHREIYSGFFSSSHAKAFQQTIEGWSEEFLLSDKVFEQ